MQSLYFALKSIHIVGFISWFAGLFYLVRIFVYHAEAFEANDESTPYLVKQYKIMEGRVYNIILMPALIITWIGGLGMLAIRPEMLKIDAHWLHPKLLLLGLLVWYHFHNKKLMSKLQSGENTWGSEKFRKWNEVPTVLMLAIVLLAVYKHLLNFAVAFSVLTGFVILLTLAIKSYKKIREKEAGLK